MERSRRQYTQALKSEPGVDRAQLLNERAVCWEYLAQDSKAQKDLLKAIELDPYRNNWLYLRMAEIDIFKRDPEAVLNHLALLRDDLRINSALHCYKGMALFMQKRYSDALIEMNRSLQLRDDNGDVSKTAHLCRAASLAQLGKTAEANAELSRMREQYNYTSHPQKEDYTFLLGKEFRFKHQSKHLIVYSRRSPDYCLQVTRQIEAFLEYFNREYFPITDQFSVTVFICESNDESKRLQAKYFPNVDSSDNIGTYFSAYNCIVTSEEARLGTITHEVTHRILDGTTVGLEPWAKEGIPAYFEKIYGYYSETPGDSEIITGFQNPWRMEELSNNFQLLDLKKIYFERDKQLRDQSEDLLLAMFLQHHGLLKKYLRLIAAVEVPGKQLTSFEDAFDKNFDEITPMWRAYLKGIKERSAICAQMPWAEIFSSKEQYNEFCKAHQQELAKGY